MCRVFLGGVWLPCYVWSDLGLGDKVDFGYLLWICLSKFYWQCGYWIKCYTACLFDVHGHLHLWACLWVFIEAERPTASSHELGLPTGIKVEGKEAQWHRHLPLCSLTKDTMWAAASCTCCHTFSIRSGLSPQPMRQNKLFPSKSCFCWGNSVIATR